VVPANSWPQCEFYFLKQLSTFSHSTISFANLSVEFPDCVFIKVDCDKVPAVKSTYKVNAFPTLVYLKNGHEVDRLVGADPDGMKEKVQNNK